MQQYSNLPLGPYGLPQFKIPSIKESHNRIEKILSDSVELFYRTGMPELAEKWQKILINYKKRKQIQEQMNKSF